MTVISVQKEEIRRFFIEKRQQLTDKEVEVKSAVIIDRLLQSKYFNESHIIHSYVSIKKNNEVDTTNLIQHCFETDKKMIVPKIIGDGKLRHFEIKSLDELQKNRWGVPEPVDGKEISIDILDLVIVPMIAGDHFKNRIGYGKGYYDRFLGKSTAIKVGLLFDCQLYDDKLPAEKFDIPLDVLLTESQQIE